MTIDTSILPLLSYWVKEQKLAERDKEQALEDGKTWLRRARLAMQKGEEELASLASEQAFAARERFRKAEARLFVIEHEKELLKAGARDFSSVYREASRKVEHMKGEFEKLGIHLEFAALEFPVDRDLSEREVLQRLRTRMESDVMRGRQPASPEARVASPPEPAAGSGAAVSLAAGSAEPGPASRMPPHAPSTAPSAGAPVPAPSQAPIGVPPATQVAASAPDSADAMDPELRALLDEIETLRSPDEG